MPAVDHAARLLDADAMLGVLQRHVPSLRDATACRIHQTRRRVSRKTDEAGAPYLGVAYELPLDRGPTPIDRWCYVKAFSRGASRAALTGHAVHIDELDAVAWPLPHDPQLTQLPAFLDAGHVQATLHAQLGGAAGAATAPPTVAIVRHEPESHCTARFELTLHGERCAVYGKAYADASWATAARHARDLWSAAAHADAFAVARPLAAVEPLRALWQAEVGGKPLRQVLHGAHAAPALARVARGLARLQSGTAHAQATLAPDDLLARTTKQCRKLIRADASLAAPLDAALATLVRVPAQAAPVLAHGDFHVDQMLCQGGRVVLFDFDNVALANPAHDVADFASQLLTDAEFDPRARQALARGFVDACVVALPRPPRADELDWHLRALLLRKAYSFFVRFRAGWRERAAEAAALAARGLDALETYSTGRAA